MNTLYKILLVSLAVLNTASSVEGIGGEKMRRRIRNQKMQR